MPEPLGGAHNDPAVTAQTLKEVLIRNLEELKKLPMPDLLKLRYGKFRTYGHFEENGTARTENVP